MTLAYGLGVLAAIAAFALRGWNRRHLTDRELFPELRSDR